MSEFKLSIKSDLKDLTAHLSRIQRQQIPFASALAITKTAQDVRTDLYRNMLKVFDAPVAYTVPRNIKEPKQRGSLYLVKATKKNLEAEVYVKNMTNLPINCFFFIQAERKDIDKMVVEYELSSPLLTGVHGESAELLARSLKAVRSAMCGKLFCAVLVDGDPYGMELRSLRKIQGTVTTIMPAASPTQHAKCVTEAALAWAAPWRLKDAVQGLPADPRAAVVQMYANEVSFGGKPGGATAERDSRKTAVQLVEECSASGALPPHPPSYRDSSDYAWCSAAVSGSLEECCRILDDVSLIDADYSRAICPPPEADALGVSALKDVPSAAAKHRQASYFDELRRRGKRNARRGEISRALPFPPSLLPAPGVVPARPEAAAARDTFLLATQHPEDRILIHRLCCEHAPAVHKRPLQNFRLFVAAAAAQSPPEITSRVLEILKTGGPPPGRFANQLADWLNIRGSLAWRVACSALAEVRDPLDTWHGAALAGQRRAARTKGAKVCRTAAECAELANSFK